MKLSAVFSLSSLESASNLFFNIIWFNGGFSGSIVVDFLVLIERISSSRHLMEAIIFFVSSLKMLHFLQFSEPLSSSVWVSFCTFVPFTANISLVNFESRRSDSIEWFKMVLSSD